jgi:excisionase family DNA binding protein
MNISQQIREIVQEVVRNEIPQLIKKEFSSQELINTREDQKELLTIKEAAKFTGYAVQTIYGYVCNRKIPFIKRPGSKFLRFKKSELIEWMSQNNKQTGPWTY